MKFKGSIDNYRGLKKGMKIIIQVPDEEVENVIRGLPNFIKRDIIVDFQIDAEKALEDMKKITQEQRGKIYALIKDISNYTSENQESTKATMKKGFRNTVGVEDFSLGNCSRELASNFIEYLLRVAFEIGVAFSEIPKDHMDEDRYFRICIEYKKCSICGAKGEVHHVNSVGSNGGRKYDDSHLRKICLCRTHHIEAHKIGWDDFAKKYHVKGVIYN